MAEKDLKAKKKRWLAIFSQKEFNNFRIGESFVEHPEQLQGKRIKASLGFLLNDMKKQNYSVTFKVTEIRGETGIADLIEYAMSSSSVKRVIRKGVGKIDDSFVLESKDGLKFAVKPLLITRHQTYASIRTSLRKKAREYFAELFKNTPSTEIFQQIISNKLQMDLKGQLRKITPVSVMEIRVMRRLS